MQDIAITSLLKMNSHARTTLTVSPTNSTDPLFDDWLVQDALEADDDNSCSSNTSPSQPETPTLAMISHSPLPAQELTSLTPALVTVIERSPPSSLAAALKDRSQCQPPSMNQAQQGQKMKTKKRKPETPPTDQIALKRQKNTDAARRSRLKKVIKMESLETRVADLEKTHQQLLLRVAVLDSEKQGLASKEGSFEDRIKVLEAQLAEAHKALACKVAAFKSFASDNDNDADADADAADAADAANTDA